MVFIAERYLFVLTNWNLNSIDTQTCTGPLFITAGVNRYVVATLIDASFEIHSQRIPEFPVRLIDRIRYRCSDRRMSLTEMRQTESARIVRNRMSHGHTPFFR
jgi:hypothetical protein